MSETGALNPALGVRLERGHLIAAPLLLFMSNLNFTAMKRDDLMVGLRFRTNNTPRDCYHEVVKVDDKYTTYVAVYPNGMALPTMGTTSGVLEWLNRPNIGLRGFQFGMYDKLKTEHPDSIILMRKGDFYHLVKADATIAARVLGITLTTLFGERYAAFPHHALDSYLPRLIRAGHRVAICEDLDLEPFGRRKIAR